MSTNACTENFMWTNFHLVGLLEVIDENLKFSPIAAKDSPANFAKVFMLVMIAMVILRSSTVQSYATMTV